MQSMITVHIPEVEQLNRNLETLLAMVQGQQQTAGMAPQAPPSNITPFPQQAPPPPPPPAPAMPPPATSAAPMPYQAPMQSAQPQAAAPAAPMPQPPPAPPQAMAAPTAAPSYTEEDIMRAGAALIDAGKMTQVQQLIQSFGLQHIGQLPQEQYGAFAGGLRELGAKL